jgi:ABC-type uncharacterized transport system auxiliary subunit
MTNGSRRTIRAVAVCIGVLSSGACGTARYPAYYLLRFEPSARAAASERGVGTLAVNELRCPDYLCEGRIVYRPTPTEVAFYQYHRWAVSPRAMVAQHLAEGVRARSLFTSVWGYESRVAADFVLSGTLERLEEVDEGRDVVAICTMSAQLLDARTQVVVWSGTVTERVAVEQRDVAGVVDGLTTAVRASVDQLIAGLEIELGSGRTPRALR